MIYICKSLQKNLTLHKKFIPLVKEALVDDVKNSVIVVVVVVVVVDIEVVVS